MMDDVDVYKELKRRGIDPTRATGMQIAAVTVRSMTPVKVGKTAGEIVATTARATFTPVPLTIERQREAGCASNVCGRYRASDDYCLQCGCGGQRLKNKRRDPNRRCPHPLRVWDVYSG